MGDKRVGGNTPVTGTGRGSGGVTGKGFMPGQSGNAGRALPPEVRAALKADTLPRYERLKKLSAEAEASGDLKTAAHIELQLLKKQIPDLSSIEVTGEDGGPLKVNATIDVTKLTADELKALRAMQAKAGKT